MLKEYFSIAEIIELNLDGYSQRTLATKVNVENWLFRVANLSHSDKPVREYHISNFPAPVREKIVNKLLEKAKLKARNNGKNIEFVQISLSIAYSRLEIILFIKNSKIHIPTFCKAYNNRELVNKELSEASYENVPNISKSRVYEWIKAYDKLGLEGIKWKADERRLGKGSFAQKDIEVKGEAVSVRDLVLGAHLRMPHLRASVIYDQLKDRIKRAKLEIPSYRTVCRYLDDWKKNNKSAELLAQNPDKWKNKHLLAIGSYSEEAIEPNYIWELDSTPSDVMLKDGRVMILGCIDVHSRRVKYLVSKTSNSLGVTALLRACILEWGVPKIVKTDNGKEYISQQIGIVLGKLGIEHRRARAFQGQEKPHIERLFGRFQHGLLTMLPNYIGSNVAERKALQSIKTFAERLFGKNEVEVEPFLTANMFQNFCNWWIAEKYMHVQHHGLNMETPASIIEGFTPKLATPEQVHELTLSLEPLAGLRTIVKKGVRVENTFFFNPNLAMYVGEQVMVRVDRFDMGKIYVFDRQHNFICEAVNYSLLGADKQAFIQAGKEIQNKFVKEVKQKTKKLINKSKLLNYIEPIQIDIEEAIVEANKKDLLNGNEIHIECKTIDTATSKILRSSKIGAYDHREKELTEEQKFIQQEIAEDLEFIIPENKDLEFKLFLEFKQKEIEGDCLSSRIRNWLEQYPESTAGRVRIKFMLEHEEIKNLYKASTKVLGNLETLVNI